MLVACAPRLAASSRFSPDMPCCYHLLGVSHPNTVTSPSLCRRFPVALFYSPPDGSEAHYLLDGPLALFPTLDALGLLDNFSTLRDNGTDQSQVQKQVL